MVRGEREEAVGGRARGEKEFPAPRRAAKIRSFMEARERKRNWK